MPGLETAINIIMIEDNEQDVFFLKKTLFASGMLIDQVIVVKSLYEVNTALKNNNINIILYGLPLKNSDGMLDFSTFQKATQQIPVIFLINAADELYALETIRNGAQDFLLKSNLDAQALKKSIGCSIERKYIRESLRISSERYQFVAEATNDMVWDWDLVNNTMFRNKEGLIKLLGDHADECIDADRWNARVHPEDVAQLKMVLAKNLEDPSVDHIECEYRMLAFDQKYIYVQDRGYIIRNERGEPLRLIGATKDITEKKLAEEAIRSSEEKYRNLFNNNPAAIFIWELAGMTFLEINDAAIKEYGYSREEFLLLNILDLGFEDEKLKMKQLSLNISQNIKFRSTGTWMHRTKKGTRLYMNVSFQGIDYHGTKASLAIAYNITDQVELEIKLANERLKRQQEITAAVIIAQEQEREQLGRELHDNINQILATTRLYIEYAQTNEERRDQFLDSSKEFIIKAVREIRNLSKSLLPPSLGEIGLVMAVEEMVNAIQQVHKCSFHIDWVHFEERILTEKLKLTIFRIIQEQLNNIITHAQAKNVWIKIVYQSNCLLVSVKDDGVGFNMGEKSKGVGLKNITSRAGLYNGAVHLHSEKGKGCELKISFHLVID